MASIVDLCWMTSEELFTDVDLDSLFVRQIEVLGQGREHSYPYVLLIHTGKITVGISLADRFEVADAAACRLLGDGSRLQDETLVSAKAVKEPLE